MDEFVLSLRVKVPAGSAEEAAALLTECLQGLVVDASHVQATGRTVELPEVRSADFCCHMHARQWALAQVRQDPVVEFGVQTPANPPEQA